MTILIIRRIEMKKSILTIALICGMALLAGAQDIKLSAGAGVNFQPNSLNLKAEQSPVIMEYGQNATSLGINAFFDATYAVVNVEYATQLGKSKNRTRNKLYLPEYWFVGKIPHHRRSGNIRIPSPRC